jgi:hypothetical protein
MTTEFSGFVTFVTVDLQTLHVLQCAGMFNASYLQNFT